MTEPRSRLVHGLRLQQVDRILDAGLIEVPEWMPAIVDEGLSGIPIVGETRTGDTIFLLVGWTTRRGLRISDFSVIATSSPDGWSVQSGYTAAQVDLAANLLDELRPHLSQRELEGWLGAD